MHLLPLAFALGTVALWATLLVTARIVRGKLYGRFLGIILGIYGLIAIAMFRWAGPLAPAFVVLHVTVFLHFGSLVWARMRPLWWRVLVSIPGSFFSAGTLLAMPWALITAIGFHPWAPWLPYALAGFGVLQSFWTRREVIDLHLDGTALLHDDVRPHPRTRGATATDARPLHVVQISDPHLGPFMSVARLARICTRAVALHPDVILLTGDFLTMESQSNAEALTRALAPLGAGRVFACRGNHDHEAPAIVQTALDHAGIRLLNDDEAVIDTPVGPVQIVGADFVWRDREAHLAALCARHPRREGHLRVVLLHDPGAFKHLPPGEGDLVLSGHTHGGQVGLVSLGFAWTFVRALTSIPDHGFWARGRDRLYVHRGTGHYGFPLRLGVPAEESLLRVHRVG